MGFVVLAAGALLVIAGAYEMYAGSGDILSERGWSAFIAGAVLVGSGVVTAALGVVVRALQAVRDTVHAPGFASDGMPSVAADNTESPVAAMPARPPMQSLDLADPPELVTPPAPISPSAPAFGREPTPMAPLFAAAPLAPTLVDAVPKPSAAPRAEPVQPQHTPAEPVPPVADEEDWLDHSFAELEREISDQHAPQGTSTAARQAYAPIDAVTPADVRAMEPAHQEPPHLEPVHPELAYHEPEPPVVVRAPEPAPPAPEPVAAHPPAAPDPAPADDGALATRVSAHEEPSSPVIGRYESEGTSYVMYADGSIDAQSEAGIYRFASMAELKAFIES